MLTLDTLAINLTRITMGTRVGDLTGRDRVTVWFSYTSPIAVQTPEMDAPLVSVNVWGPNTGKHLNIIDGGDEAARARRVPHEAVLVEVDHITPAVAL